MADTTIDLLKNSSYVGKMDELIAAVKSGGGATSDVEWDNVKNKPTTIVGYGITDAKIDNGTITLGNQTITPLTSAPVTSVNSKTGVVVLTAADVGALPNTTTIPDKTSQLDNDSGYITNSALTDYAKKTEIPTKTSELTNDSGYITAAQAPVQSVNNKTGAVTLSAADVSAIPSTLTGTAGQVLTKTADGQEWKDVDIPTALPNPNALTFTGAVTGSYDGSSPLEVEIPSGFGGGESFELLYDITLAESVDSFVQEIPPCKKAKMLIFPNASAPVTGWKRVFINGTSYPTSNKSMAIVQALFVEIDTGDQPNFLAYIGVYKNLAINGAAGDVSIGYSLTGNPTEIYSLGCNTPAMLNEGAVIKIWGVKV